MHFAGNESQADKPASLPSAASVACVIPTHNRSDFLAQALRSVLGQTRLPDQIIVVSDVTDERSRAVCVQLSRPELKIDYYESPIGRHGASSSRNFGAAVAHGAAYLAFLDDDDLWCEDHLAKTLDTLFIDGVDLVASGLREFSDSGERDGVLLRPNLSSAQVGAINAGVTGSNFIIRRAVFIDLEGFDESLHVKNDTDFFYRFLLAGHSYAAIPERLVRQRKHGSGQLTGKSLARAAGIDMYVKKHQATLTFKNRRELRLAAHRMRASAATSWFGRVAHRTAMALYYPPSQIPRLILKGQRRDYLPVAPFDGDSDA